MARGQTSVTVIPGPALDDELARLFGSVERARRNRWFEGDVIDDRFGRVLAAVTNRAPLEYAAGLGFGPAHDDTPNRWLEDRIVSEACRRS